MFLACGVLVSGTRADESSSEAGWRNRLRERLLDDEARGRYGLTFESPEVAGRGRVAVLVHGFNSSPAATDGLIAPVRAAGFPCGSFAYPNDQRLCRSSEFLSDELRRLQKRRPRLRVTLVTHSMGGLVARGCIEAPGLDPGNVDRLVMVAPPSHGSMLANAAVATDLWEHWWGRRWGSPWRRTKDAIIDGLGEAATDLAPGSAYLVGLNSRPRNAAVRYSLVLGSAGSVTDDQVRWFRERCAGTLDGLRAPGAAKRVDRLLADCEEVVDGKGDGVVALKRARLAGVDDVVVLPFGHLEVTRAGGDAGVDLARAAILERVVGGVQPGP